MELLIIFLSVLVGVFCTFFLNRKLNLGAVRASATVGVIVGMVWHFWPHFLGEIIPFCIFGGSFIGMMTAEKHVNIFTWLLSSFIFSILYLYKSKDFEGLGGLLGISALISILVSVGLIICFEKIFKKNI